MLQIQGLSGKALRERILVEIDTAREGHDPRTCAISAHPLGRRFVRGKRSSLRHVVVIAVERPFVGDGHDGLDSSGSHAAGGVVAEQTIANTRPANLLAHLPHERPRDVDSNAMVLPEEEIGDAGRWIGDRRELDRYTRVGDEIGATVGAKPRLDLSIHPQRRRLDVDLVATDSGGQCEHSKIEGVVAIDVLAKLVHSRIAHVFGDERGWIVEEAGRWRPRGKTDGAHTEWIATEQDSKRSSAPATGPPRVGGDRVLHLACMRHSSRRASCEELEHVFRCDAHELHCRR